MNESQPTASAATDKEGSLPAPPEAKDLCHGIWRLKPQVVLRTEEDGAIVFDPDSDALLVVNVTGSALLRSGRHRICYEDWCAALQKHYGATVQPVQIRDDLRKFLREISCFTEPCDVESRQVSVCA